MSEQSGYDPFGRRAEQGASWTTRPEAGPAPAGGPPPPAQPPARPEWAPPPATAAGDLAGWWERVGATLIDGVVIVVSVVLLVVLALAGGEIGIVAGLLGWLVGAFLYAPLMTGLFDGQTLGKMALGIRVRKADGRRLTLGDAFVRELAIKGIVMGILNTFVVGIVGYLWPLWDAENRAWHDMLAGTRVVTAR